MSSPQTLRQVPRRRASHLADDGTAAEILAAGAVCWRLRRGELQVLVIHRPRYDDWSLPKGKLDDGETLPECAVREVAEEIGVKVRLGVPLPITRYDIVKNSSGKNGKSDKNGKNSAPRARPKEVWYWAAEADEQKPRPDGEETDEVRWVSPAQAREMLTNPGDVEPVDALEQLHQNRALRTVPFIVLRHAKAKPRSSWSRAESDRPLAATGKRQAKEVEALLSAWRPRHLESSPWKRCVETLAPYVKRHRHRIKYRKSLTEKRAREEPRKAKNRTQKSLELLQPACLCTHRPVLPLVLDQLRSWVKDPALLDAMPESEPYLRPGAVVVAQQAVDRGGEVVSLEVYEPFDD